MTDVDDLLQKTSRTFAITIPMLPMPTRQEVGVAYLLFRIVDTFEDATLLAAEPSASRPSGTSSRCSRRPTRRGRAALRRPLLGRIRPSSTPATSSCCARSRSSCASSRGCRS